MKRCKREGDVVNLDRISDLPEALILKILCLLPTKKAIATSVLSKQWKSHWKMMPQLKFNSLYHILDLENVCKSLLTHKAPVIESLHLKFRSNKCSQVDIGIFIGIAFTRNVRDLVLQVYKHKGSFIFPRCLYSCETLETLKLTVNVTYMDVPCSVCLKSLRTLHLNYVEFKDEESVRNLLSGCPNLEDFMLRRNPRCTVKTFTIAVSSLQRLSINYGIDKEEDWRYVINAPCLKSFKIQGVKTLESCLIEYVPELVEASIINVSKIIDDKLVGSLTLVKRLSLALSPGAIEFPTGTVFYKLVYLELHTNKETWWNLLILMLDACPKLQVLKLLALPLTALLVELGGWNEPKNVPECLLRHLETFVWEGYVSGKVQEKQVAKYILKNANRLKRATFSSSKDMTPKKKLVVANDLKSVVASSSCQFQFE